MKKSTHRIASPIKTYIYDTILSFDNIYEGIVVDRIDIEGAGKIKVYIPELMEMQVNWESADNIPGIWVKPIKQHEFQFIVPQLNEIVLIKFLYGDPEFPVYIGTVPSYDEGNLDILYKLNPIEPGQKQNWFKNPIPYYTIPSKEVKNIYSDEEKKDLPDFYLHYFGPISQTRFVINDSASYNYSELMTYKGYGLHFCDKNNSSLFTSQYFNHILMYDSKDTTESKIELRTSQGAALELDQAKRTTFVHGHNLEFLIFTDDNQITLTNTGKYKTKKIKVGSCKDTSLDSRNCEINTSDVSADDMKKMAAYDHLGRKITIQNNRIFIQAGTTSIIIKDNADILLLTENSKVAIQEEGQIQMQVGKACFKMTYDGRILLNSEPCDIEEPELESGGDMQSVNDNRKTPPATPNEHNIQRRL